MAYGFTLTSAGRTLLLQLQAGEVSPFVISRIAVGDGVVPDGTNPATLTGLIHEVARSQATCTVPIVEADTLNFEIEYRNKWDAGTFGDGYTDPTGLTESFWLQEYGVFALNAQGQEILLYYANLGEFPESVARWNGRNLVSKRYPVSISIVDDETEVNLLFPANAFITSEYLEERLSASPSGVELSDADVPEIGTKTHYRIAYDVPNYRPTTPPPDSGFPAILAVDGAEQPGAVSQNGAESEPMVLQLG